MTWHQACATTGPKKNEKRKSTKEILRVVLDAIVFWYCHTEALEADKPEIQGKNRQRLIYPVPSTAALSLKPTRRSWI